MVSTTEELIQIGLIIGIIIVFGYLAFTYLKNKGVLEKLTQKRTQRPETKSLSFAKNRKMRGLEKLIPEKKLSRKPILTELKIESTDGLWEPEEEKPITEIKKEEILKKPEIKLSELNPETKGILSDIALKIKTGKETKKPETKEVKPTDIKKETKEKGLFGKLSLFDSKQKTEEKIKETKFNEELKQAIQNKPEKKTELKEKNSIKSAETFALPQEKTKTDELTIARKLEEKIKAYQEKAKTIQEKPKTNVLFDSKEEKEKHEQKFVQKILESEDEELEKISKAIDPKTDKNWQKEKEETIKALKKEFMNLDKTDKKDLWKKPETTQEEIKKPIKEKLIPEKKETINLKPKTEIKEKPKETKKSFFGLFKRKKTSGKKPETEKKETALKPELKTKGTEIKEKKIIELKKEKELIKPSEFKHEIKKTGTSTEELNAEMKKLIEEQQKARGIKPRKKPEISVKDIEFKKEIPVKPEIKEKTGIEPEKKAEIKFEPEEEIKTEPEKEKIEAKEEKEFLEKPEIKKEQIKLKEKTEVKPKSKGLFERFGLGKEKINLNKDEEDQLQKIMIVLKGKTAEYSREDMREAMKNLGYSEKIIEEAIKRLY